MPQPPESARLSFRVFYIAPLAFVLRLLYLTEHARSPLFQYPVLDALYYDTVARLLAQGESLTAINPGFRPLLYPWLLSRLYLLTPESALFPAIIAQHVLGVASTVLTIWIAFRLSQSNMIAAVAGMLFVLAGPPLYFEGEILLTALTTFLNLSLIAFLVRFLSNDPEASKALDRRLALLWASAAVLLGLAAQTRPNVLLFLPALLLGAVFVPRATARTRHRQRAWMPVASSTVILIGLFLTLALFGALQRQRFGQFQLLTGAGGVNFYLGNKQGADGMIPRQDRAVTYADSYRDSVQVFAREEHARARGVPADEATSSEISRYWLGRGLEEIRQAPLAWGRLMARKAWFVLWNREIPNNRSYQWTTANESRVLRWLPVRWWLLISLTPLGAASLWVVGRRRAVFWVISFVICWSASLVLFFVNGRFRAPLWPLMCILAAAGGTRLIEALTEAVQKKKTESLLLPLAATLALATLSLVNWLGIPELAPGRDFFYRSVANLELGRLEQARGDAEAAVAAERTQAMHHFQLASVYLAENRPRDAVSSLGEAGRLKPNEPRIWNNLGVALEELDRPAEAYANYLKAIDQMGDYAPALTNAALLELRSGRLETAAAHLEHTGAARDTSVHTLCARAFLARAEGRDREAETLLEKARTIDSETVGRLDEESRKPVSLDPA